MKLTTERHEPGTDIADRKAIVFTKVGDRFVIRRQAARQPHHFHIAPGLPFKAAARLHPIEVAVYVKLQKNRGVVRNQLHLAEIE